MWFCFLETKLMAFFVGQTENLTALVSAKRPCPGSKHRPRVLRIVLVEGSFLKLAHHSFQVQREPFHFDSLV